jgi:hypothetical protein
MKVENGRGAGSVVPIRGGGVRDWQSWAPYGAVAWSLLYGLMGLYWAVSGHGFPYTPESMSDGLGQLLGRLGPDLARIVRVLAGIPAAALAAAAIQPKQAATWLLPGGATSIKAQGPASIEGQRG